MTQNLLSFDEVPIGGQFSLPTTDRGVISGAMVSAATVISASTTLAQTKFVAKNGVDATGDGSIAKPYLTVAAAMASISDAAPATKPYMVAVSPGVFADPFTVKNGVYVVGSGSGPGNFNGSPLEAVTILAPTAAQVLDASFAGAGSTAGGIMNCGLSTLLQASFLAIGATGNATFSLQNIITDSGVTLIGAGTGLDYGRLDDVYSNAAGANPFTFTNMGGVAIDNSFNDFATTDYVINHSAAMLAFFTLFNGMAKTLTINWTAASIANFCNVLTYNFNLTAGYTLNGNGGILTGTLTKEVTATDAAQVIRFTNNAAGTIAGACGGTTIVSCTPTAARLFTIAPTQSNVGGQTTVIIKNLSPTFPIDLAFTSSSPVAGSTTYVPPLGQVRCICPTKIGAGFSPWYVDPIVQSGSAVLVNGVSSNIAADVSANSRIVASLKTVSGAFGTPVCGGRVNGSRAGGGLFVITSTLPATGATVATDLGTYDWHIENS